MSLDFDSARLPNTRLKPEHHEWRAQLRRFFDRESIKTLGIEVVGQ